MNIAVAAANSGTPWLTVAGAIPLVGAIVVALLPVRFAKMTALAVAVADLIWVIVMATQFSTSGPTYQFTEQYSWIPQFGVHYAVGADGIALVLIGMTAVLMPVVILASWHDADGPGIQRSPKTYFALMLALDTMMIGVFAATDVFLFYVFFEAMLVPMYFMIGSFGVGPRQYAAVKFLLYSLLGGLLMLVAVIALYVYSSESAVTGHHGTFMFYTLAQLALSSTVQKWLFLGFFVAFAIKAPLWPFHTWLPDAASSAQPGAAVLMLGVMDKVGTFGMIRYCLELFPDGFHYFTPLILVLAVISIIYGAIVAIGQTSMKRLIGYTSISHFGFIVLGIFALTSQGQSGATLYMVNHGFATGALFLLAGFLIVRRGSDRIADYGGVQRVAPLLAGLFLVSGLAGLSLPGLSTFVSEFLVLVGTFSRYKVAGSFAVAGIVLAAIYILWMYQRTMNGPTAESVAAMPDLRVRELLAVVPLVALIIAMGVYPKPVLDVINPAVKATMSQVGSVDPVPAHPAAAQNGAQP
ncbi:MAG TPA: NADH-quinone oxidoreductase subunit M [Trebonia sp.]|nr:NADH-quinone oxidoreductase subunit M [Trebonia sp.]